MRIIKSISAALGSTLLLGNLAFAQGTIDQRERRQERRIAHGVKDGELTKKEARRLEQEQWKIRRDEARAKADGNFTPKERARIQREEDRANRDIYRDTHNNQTR